jgi:integral membrane sensor domain MASE1
MKNATFSNAKDNVAAALVLAAVAVAIVSAAFNTKPAHADEAMPVIKMETIVVTASREKSGEQIVKLDTIVVTASRINTAA